MLFTEAGEISSATVYTWVPEFGVLSSLMWKAVSWGENSVGEALPMQAKESELRSPEPS